MLKVFFSCSSRDILKYKDNYKSIVETIKESGFELTRDWLDASIKLAEKHKNEPPRSNHYQNVMRGIMSADIVIFDSSVQSMSIGHQLTFALDKSKTTLLISNESQNQISKLFISGSDSPYLTIKAYKNSTDLKDIVKNFLLENNQKPKIRFNLVINKEQDTYLSWASFQYKIEKTKFIKNLIDMKIKTDEIYQDYFKKQI